MSDLAHALQNKWRSLADLQSLILAGKHGNAPGRLKPEDSLKAQELCNELTARGEDTEDKLKTDQQDKLTSLLKGAQRVPTLLVSNPSQPLTNLNLEHYKVLDSEPLHDLKGHLNNLLPEIPHLLPPNLRTLCRQTLHCKKIWVDST